MHALPAPRSSFARVFRDKTYNTGKKIAENSVRSRNVNYSKLQRDLAYVEQNNPTTPSSTTSYDNTTQRKQCRAHRIISGKKQKTSEFHRGVLGHPGVKWNSRRKRTFLAQGGSICLLSRIKLRDNKKSRTFEISSYVTACFSSVFQIYASQLKTETKIELRYFVCTYVYTRKFDHSVRNFIGRLDQIIIK